jgi:hypothetical protein
MYTKAAVDAAIAAAIAGIAIGDTGDLCASLRATKTGWLMLNGQGIGNVGSGTDFANASAQALFTLLWNINGGTWPILNSATGVPARGASAAADWASVAPYKKIPLPDARGCVLGMVDLGRGITPDLAVGLGLVIGNARRSLDITNIPSHVHGGVANPAGASGSGGGSGVPAVNSGGNTSATGGDPAAVPPFSIPVPVDIVQPTMSDYIFIKL